MTTVALGTLQTYHLVVVEFDTRASTRAWARLAVIGCSLQGVPVEPTSAPLTVLSFGVMLANTST